MIKFDNVSFKYNEDGENILHDLDFELKSGSYHFLSGPSGAGKTSLMNLMHAATMPTSGTVTILDQETNILPRQELFALRQKIGIVFQDFRLFNHLSTFDNVALPLRIMNKSEEELTNNVNELLEWVGLGKHKDDLPLTLSGGQQQRIAIARAIIGQPEILLADEPTGNLDDEIGFRLMGLFEQLNRMGTTIIIATHNMQMIEQFAHPCLTIQNGYVHKSEQQQSTPKIRHVF